MAPQECIDVPGAEADGRVIAVLKLSDPAAHAAVAGELEFNRIFVCDVGDKNSDAVIKLNTTKFFAGGPVRIDRFRLAMP
jgi:hypothetical protein